MEVSTLVYLHLVTILPAMLIGTYLMIVRKGSPVHKLLGKGYMGLMLVTALVTLFIPAQLGPALFGHFGFIHGLSLLTLITVPQAYFAVKRRDIATHKKNMISLYCGGILLAGFFAFSPGRLLHTWLFA